jgi:predicted porin
MHGSKKKGLYLAAAINGADKDTTGAKSMSYTRLSAQYAVAGLVANAMYQISDTTGAEGNNIMVGLGYKMGKMMPKLKYSTTSEDKNSGNEGTVVALGLDYKMAKKTTAYVEIGSFDKKYTTTKGYTSVAVGLLHKF